MSEERSVLAAWHKSSLCDSGSCVEVQIGQSIVRVRNSNNESGVFLEFTLPEWSSFIEVVRSKNHNPSRFD